jgi:hypothetical protein
MTLKSTQTKLIVLLLISQFFLAGSIARPLVYCTPTFANGCFNWYTMDVTLGTLSWASGATCTDYDFTSLSTTLNAGTTYPMSVTSGVWCGCSVWIDFNQDEVFDASENLHHEYVGGDPSYSYIFNIMIPANTPTGNYRMRIVSGWGSDGFSVGANGYGPCGSYQYGNFVDFSVNVVGPTGIADLNNVSDIFIQANPNPMSNSLTVVMKSFSGNESTLKISDMTGKIVQSIPVQNEKEVLDVSSLAKGIYMLNYSDGTNSRNIRLVK